MSMLTSQSELLLHVVGGAKLNSTLNCESSFNPFNQGKVFFFIPEALSKSIQYILLVRYKNVAD